MQGCEHCQTPSANVLSAISNYTSRSSDASCKSLMTQWWKDKEESIEADSCITEWGWQTVKETDRMRMTDSYRDWQKVENVLRKCSAVCHFHTVSLHIYFPLNYSIITSPHLIYNPIIHPFWHHHHLIRYQISLISTTRAQQNSAWLYKVLTILSAESSLWHLRDSERNFSLQRHQSLVPLQCQHLDLNRALLLSAN